MAASGAIAASTLAPLPKHLGLMWDVNRAQSKFWKENPDWMKQYYGDKTPYHPRGQHPVGGAEHMEPSEYFRAKEGATKSSAYIGKGGMTAVGEELRQPVKQSKPMDNENN